VFNEIAFRLEEEIFSSQKNLSQRKSVEQHVHKIYRLLLHV